MRALQLLLRHARHPRAERPVKACHNPKDDCEDGGEAEEGKGRAREPRWLPQLGALVQRQLELLARGERDLDLRFAGQVVGVARSDREHVVAVDGDHDEIQDRTLAHGGCRRHGLGGDALGGRFDAIAGEPREELRAEGDDRTIADLQFRRLLGRNPLIRSRPPPPGVSRRLGVRHGR